MFGKKAELAEKYIKKGHNIYLAGRMQTREWTNKEGQKVQTTEIVCESVDFLTPKDQSAEAPAQRKPEAGNSFEDFDDDVPF